VLDRQRGGEYRHEPVLSKWNAKCRMAGGDWPLKPKVSGQYPVAGANFMEARTRYSLFVWT
jgi:hypothetical protein